MINLGWMLNETKTKIISKSPIGHALSNQLILSAILTFLIVAAVMFTCEISLSTIGHVLIVANAFIFLTYPTLTTDFTSMM